MYLEYPTPIPAQEIYFPVNQERGEMKRGFNESPPRTL